MPTGILGTRIMAALAALFNFLALNLVLLVFSLPVITLPAAVSAATHALDRWRRDGEDQVVREFLIGFRAEWTRQTVLVGVPLAAAVVGVVEARHFAAGTGAAAGTGGAMGWTFCIGGAILRAVGEGGISCRPNAVWPMPFKHRQARTRSGMSLRII